MKVILIEIPYGYKLILPVELSGFLPQITIVLSEGYGQNEKLTCSTRPPDFTFINTEDIRKFEPVDPPEPPPSSVAMPTGIETIEGQDIQL